MTALVPVLQAIVREELTAGRAVELGVVTRTYTDEAGDGATNLAVDLRLRGSALELQHVPVAVGRLGMSLAPREGDLAVVAFVGHDLHGGVILGFLYDEQAHPPKATPAEVVYAVPDDEQDGVRRLHLELPNGNTLSVEDAKLTVTMGATTVVVEGDGDIRLTAKGAVAIEAGGDLTLKAGKAVTVEAGTDAAVKGVNVTVQGQASAALKGATTSIAGVTSFSAS
jgi:uncharacterized protein involved in type VI secretion and phage assembly